MKTRANMESLKTYGRALIKYQKLMAITATTCRKSMVTLSQLGLLMEGFLSTI
jgi:hypothetical protein